jgi:hypothetical protein
VTGPYRSRMGRDALENGPDEEDYITVPCGACVDGRVPARKFAPAATTVCPDCEGDRFVQIPVSEYDPDYAPGGEW